MLPTIESLASDLAAGRTTSLALTRAALDRACDPAGEGARTFIRVDAERAVAAAQASDALRAAGIVRSPLDGLPVSAKDLFDIAGQVTLAGSVVRNDAPPAARNAVVIDRLLQAGAVVVGRTNMTEFAFSGLGLNPHHGTPRNPWDRQRSRIPGGSSSGAAVSVTDGMAAVAVGSDTGGSVRIPSALCGLTGFKPTARRVPLDGALPLSTTLDSIGPLGASVRCCAIVDSILAGVPVDPPPAADLAGLRLAVPTDVALDDIDDLVGSAFEAACAQLTAAGARVSRISVPEFRQLAAINGRGTFAAVEAWAWHRGQIATSAARYDPRVVSRISLGERMGAADYIDLLAARKTWIAAVEARIGGFDALLMPTVPRIAPPIDSLECDDTEYFKVNGLMLRNPTLINFLDGCALSVPCHAPGSAPVGLMIAAPGGTDRRVLAVGQAIERELLRAR